MPFKMMPKWGHWFWITAVLLEFSAPIPVLSIGRGGFERDLNTGVSLTDPLPFPVFAGPHIAQGPLTIVTPSTVVRYHGVELSTQPDRQSAGFARRLDDELPALAKAIHQSASVDKTNQSDPGDVSVSKSVSVVSVKYSLSGERRRRNKTQEVEFQQNKQTIQNAATSFDTSTTTTTPPTTSDTTIRPLMVRINSTERVSNINPSKPTSPSSSSTLQFISSTTTTAPPTSTSTIGTTTRTTTSVTTTSSTTTTSASTTGTETAVLSTEISTAENLKPNVAQPAEEELTQSSREVEASPRNDELFISEVAPSAVRADKSLFASTEKVRFVQHAQVSSDWPSSTFSSQTVPTTRSTSTTTTSTSTYRPSPRLVPKESDQTSSTVASKNPNTSSTEKTTTSTTIDFLATPTRIFLQEVEVIPEDGTSNNKDLKPLDPDVPGSVQDDTKVTTNRSQNSSDSNGKMIVEYLEDAELARSFPSTKWNVYEDKDGTWYLQKYPQKGSKEEAKTEPQSRVDVELEELPKVVDVSEGGGLSLFDGGDSDRDEEPYEKFMAEESGRSSPDVSSTNEEYTDTSSDDDLLPSYDERNFEEEIVEPRMLSTAQKPSNVGIARDHLREADSQPQRRKPMTIDVTTVVGITVGAFLFILIGTVGLGAFIYHEKYMNKPQTLEDRYSSTDSDGSSVDDPYRRISHIDCVGFDTTRDTFCEEMYNLDNDSFLNSLETVNAPSSYWIHDSRHSDSDV